MTLGRSRRRTACAHRRVLLDPVAQRIELGGEPLLIATLVCRDCSTVQWGLWEVDASGRGLGRLRRGPVELRGAWPGALADVGCTGAEIAGMARAGAVSLVDGISVPDDDPGRADAAGAQSMQITGGQ